MDWFFTISGGESSLPDYAVPKFVSPSPNFFQKNKESEK